MKYLTFTRVTERIYDTDPTGLPIIIMPSAILCATPSNKRDKTIITLADGSKLLVHEDYEDVCATLATFHA